MRDNAIFLYGGQRLVEGVPPYVSIFDLKGPLAPALAGAGVWLSRYLPLDDIYSVRVLFFLLGCFAVVSVYLLGSMLFESRLAGFFSALTFLGFSHFALFIASGPEVKVPVVLFQTLSLLLTAKKKWFWAALFGSLASLVWQPLVIFPLVTLFLAAAQRPRLPAVVATVAGVGLPLAVTSLYFHLQGAFHELLEGAILFHARGSVGALVDHPLRPIMVVNQYYRAALIPIVLGFMMVALSYRRVVRLKEFLRGDAFAPLLLSFPLVVIWPLLDFQGPSDFYTFLPYAAVGFGGFLVHIARPGERVLAVGVCLALLVAAWINPLLQITNTSPATGGLEQQREAALEIRERYGEDARIISIGAPQVLVFLHEENPNPYLFIRRGIDRQIARETPGGFAAWLRELEAYDPDVIAFGQPNGDHTQQLMEWLDSNYKRERVDPWTLYVRKR